MGESGCQKESGLRLIPTICRVDEDVSTLIPHRPGRAQLRHPVLHDAVSLGLAY